MSLITLYVYRNMSVTASTQLDKLQHIHNLLARLQLMLLGLSMLLKVFAVRTTTSYPSHSEFTSKIKMAQLVYKATIIFAGPSLGLRYHPTRQLRSSSAHLFLKSAVAPTFTSRAFSAPVPMTHSNLTCILLTLLVHFNFS